MHKNQYYLAAVKTEKKRKKTLWLIWVYIICFPPLTIPISPHFPCMRHVHQSHHITCRSDLKNHFTQSQANKYKTKIKTTTPDHLAPFQSHASSKTDITHSVTFVGPQAESHHLSCHWLNKPLYIQKISCTLSPNILSVHACYFSLSPLQNTAWISQFYSNLFPNSNRHKDFSLMTLQFLQLFVPQTTHPAYSPLWIFRFFLSWWEYLSYSFLRAQNLHTSLAQIYPLTQDPLNKHFYGLFYSYPLFTTYYWLHLPKHGSWIRQDFNIFAKLITFNMACISAALMRLHSSFFLSHVTSSVSTSLILRITSITMLYDPSSKLSLQ